jgi:curved DNA-binding protein CbpA
MSEFTEADFEKLKNVNLYEILQVTPEFTKKQLKEKYRDLIRQYHPDKQEDGVTETIKTKFLAIQLAYTILSNPEHRAKYDEYYDASDSIANSNTLKELYKTNSVYIEKLSPEEFESKMKTLNVGECPDFYDENGEMKKGMEETEAVSALSASAMTRTEVDEMLKKEQQDMRDYFQKYDADEEEEETEEEKKERLKARQDDFNSYFEQNAIVDEAPSQMMVFNDVTHMSGADANDYASMYSGKNMYEQSFAVSRPEVFVESELTMEERMAQYYSQTTKLDEMARHSTKEQCYKAIDEGSGKNVPQISYSIDP